MVVQFGIRSDLLERVGGIPANYAHEDREMTPGQPLQFSNGIVKWSSVHRTGTPVPPEETEAAREFVLGLDHDGMLDVDQGLGFVVHHVSTAHAFLLIGFWRDKNELWMTHRYRAVDEPAGAFKRAPIDGISTPFACVWELLPIWHERNAWSRYLKSTRDQAAKEAYLADGPSGIA